MCLKVPKRGELYKWMEREPERQKSPTAGGDDESEILKRALPFPVPHNVT